MKKTFAYFIPILIILTLFINNASAKFAYANEFEDSTIDQLEQIDFSELNDFLEGSSIDFNVVEEIKKMIKGEYDYNFFDFINVLLSGSLSWIKNNIHIFLSIISLGVLSVIFGALKTKNLSSSVEEILLLVFFVSISLILFGNLSSLFNNVKNAITNLTKLLEIMSPIILSLMIIAGGKVSNLAYTPAVTFLSSGVFGLINKFLLPLVTISLILEIISVFSTQVRLNKLSEFIGSLIKWTFGIIIFIFTTYLTIQGVTVGVHDGISIKATKYLLSNSVPIVGSILKDGFDVLVGGAILIKNSVGVCGVVIAILTVMPIIINLLSFSFALKLTGAVLDTVSNQKFSNLCSCVVKFINYLLAFLIICIILICVLFIMFIASSNSLV